MIKTLIKSVILISVLFVGCVQEKSTRVIYQDFNTNWKFKLQKEKKVSNTFFTEDDWKVLNVPHDWSVEHSFDTIYNGATAYLPGGIGWYTKDFQIEKNPSTTNYIVFDGVYNNSKYWLNDKYIGERPYGYAPFYFDITNELTAGNNLLKVKVDHSRYIDSRWYSGSGIYRKVKFVTKNKLHIPIWGTFVTTPKVSKSSATIDAKVKVKNNFDIDKNFNIVFEIFNKKGVAVSTTKENLSVKAGTEAEFQLQQEVSNPQLWGVDNPYLYQAMVNIEQQGEIVDREVVPIGIRSIKFNADKGFFLNGENMKIKGVCLHHDAGLVGAAVPKDVWRRRFNLLKKAGCNAIRVSHNPASEEFLDLCDEMGFLVQNEFFDEWDNPKDKRWNQEDRHDDYVSRGYAEHFQKWAHKDLINTMLRDRNHPSVFQWSIGNEIEWSYPVHRHASGFFNMGWTGGYFFSTPPIPKEQIKERYDDFVKEQQENFDPTKKYNKYLKGNYVCAETAQKLSQWTRELDTTRYVTANLILPSVSMLSGYGGALDVAGFSYRRVMYDYAHEHYPNKVIMGTENVGQWHEWKAIAERPFISGTFLWTGIDYMGEANRRGKVMRGLKCGMIDFAGFKEPRFHMMKSLWNDEPHLFIVSNTLAKSKYKVDKASGKIIEKKAGYWKKALWFWHEVQEHWNYQKDGEKLIVELYSNCDAVELFLNNESLGKKKLSDFEDHIYKWAVSYTKGTLKAIGTKKGKIVSDQIITAGKPSRVQLSVDKMDLINNNEDVAHIVAQIVDKNGVPIKHLNQKITFDINGDIKVLGVDNGDHLSMQDYQSDTIFSHKGRALLIVQAKNTKGKSTIKASSQALLSNEITLNIK